MVQVLFRYCLIKLSKEEYMKFFDKFTLITVLVYFARGDYYCLQRRRWGGQRPGCYDAHDTTQSRQVASSGTQGINMGAGSATTFQNLGQIGLSSAAAAAPPMRIAGARTLDPGLAKAAKLSAKIAKSRAVSKAVAAFHKAKTMNAMKSATTTTIPMSFIDCSDGGSIDFDGSIDTGTGVITLNLNADSCRESGSVLTGLMSITGSTDASGAFNVTEQLGIDADNMLSILEFSDNNYTVLVSQMDTLVTMSMNGGVSTTTGSITSSTIGANGTMNVLDFFNQGSYNMTFTNLSIGMSDTTAASGVRTNASTVNGGFSESWTDASVAKSVSMTFSQFAASDVHSSATAAPYDESIAGGFSVAFTPKDCVEGAYSFETKTPVHYDASGMTTAGEININSTADVTYLNDGTITVATDGTPVYSGDEFGLASVCAFQTFDEPAPVSSGSTGTTSGSSMTVTLSWNGPGGVSSSDMDLHMNYYNTQTPTAATTGSWYIDYHSSDPGSSPFGTCTSGICASPTGLTMSNGVDLNNDGIYDIGLDFDNTDGYGPEHITATVLPAGYYVISVDAYSSNDPTVPVSVSVQIGSAIFGPFTHTFGDSTTSALDIADGEAGTSGNAAAWFPVADLKVDGSGNVQVLAHNPDLEPWHDGAFGLAAPAMRARKLK